MKCKLFKLRLCKQTCTKQIRIAVIICLIGILIKPISNYFFKEDFYFHHTDIEAGIFCDLSIRDNNTDLSCLKNDLIGLSLNDVDVNTKKWNYKIDNGSSALTFTRIAIANGFKITAKGTMFNGEVAVKVFTKKT